MKNLVIPPTLRWACRRGMLELDILLGNFLEEIYLTLSSEMRLIFEQLLLENDQDLFMWLTGKEMPTRTDFIAIIEKIRFHAKHRHSL
jgi:antitoxin CptB